MISSELKGDTADLYKAAKAGDILLGNLRLGPTGTKAHCTISYLIPAQIKEAEKDGDEKEEPKLVDLKLQIVDKIKNDEEKRAYLDSLLAETPKHLPLLVASLKAIKEDAAPENINRAADAVLSEIDENALASYLGRKPPPANELTDDDKKLKKEMDLKRSAWTLAYSRKLQASNKAETSAEQQKHLFLRYSTFLEAPEKDTDFGLISAKRDIASHVSGLKRIAYPILAHLANLSSDTAPH